MNKLDFSEFKACVKSVYNGKIRFREDCFTFYAQLTGRKIRFRKQAQFWIIELYMDGRYACQGSGETLLDAEISSQKNYDFNRRWNSIPLSSNAPKIFAP